MLGFLTCRAFLLLEIQSAKLAKEAADEELSELDILPVPQLRTSREIVLLLNGIVTEEKLVTVYIELDLPEALFSAGIPLAQQHVPTGELADVSSCLAGMSLANTYEVMQLPPGLFDH